MKLLSKSISKYFNSIFLKWNEVRIRYLQAQVYGKNWGLGGKGKIPRHILNNFSKFFIRKISIFLAFKRYNSIRFSKQLEKENVKKLNEV